VAQDVLFHLSGNLSSFRIRFWWQLKEVCKFWSLQSDIRILLWMPETISDVLSLHQLEERETEQRNVLGNDITRTWLVDYWWVMIKCAIVWRLLRAEDKARDRNNNKETQWTENKTVNTASRKQTTTAKTTTCACNSKKTRQPIGLSTKRTNHMSTNTPHVLDKSDDVLKKCRGGIAVHV